MKKTLDITTDLDSDSLGKEIGRKWASWDSARAEWKSRYQETLQYLYATETDSIIGQSAFGWKSNTHIPKLTQLRDLLITYYMESLFSLEDYIEWKASTANSDTLTKRNLIREFVKDMLNKGDYKRTTEKLIEDYVDSGNAFAMPEFLVDIVKTKEGLKERFKGVKIRRINPMDIVFNPLAIDFKSTPKIIRSVKTIGELSELAESDAKYKKAFNRMMKNRELVREAYSQGADIKGDSLAIGGFGSLDTYCTSDACELLTFLGDIYDTTTNKNYKNAKIVVMDRSIVLSNETFEDTEDFNCIFQACWRNRKDTLWGMSPLENLLGMQSRIDYLENKRADVYDFVSNPILVTLGEVELPERIEPGVHISGDATAHVTYLSPDTSVLQHATLMAEYSALMEEYVGAPREMMGFTTPGEKTAFQYSQILTAAQRVFQKKIRNYELMSEELINAALQMYLYHCKGQSLELKLWDDDVGAYLFKKIQVEDLKGEGAIVAVGSTSYADKGRLAQTVSQLGNSGIFMDPAVQANISPTKLAETIAFATGLDKIQGLFRKNARLYEAAEQQEVSAKLQRSVESTLSEPTLDEILKAQEDLDEKSIA